jgi:hypothetical protein
MLDGEIYVSNNCYSLHVEILGALNSKDMYK